MDGITQKLEAFLTSKILMYVVVFVLAIKVASVAFLLPLPANFFFADITRSQLNQLLNQSRESLGLNTLTENEALDQAARLKAQDMVSNDYFAHQSPQGITPWYWFGQVGYTYKYAGENLAVGFIDSPEVFNAWLNSPSHKANILNPNYKEVGTAVLPGFEGNSIVVVQLFGSQKAAAVASKPQKPKSVPVIKPTPPPAPLIQPTNPVESFVEVLGTEDVSYEKAGSNTADSPYLKFLNFIVYNNGQALQYAAYLLLLAVVGCMLLNIAISAEKMHGLMVVRSLVLIGIVCTSLWVSPAMLSHIIPHTLVI